MSEQSQEPFRLVAENVRDFAVHTKDLDGRASSWNPGVERLLGYSEEEWVGMRVSVIFTPEDIARGEPNGEMRTALAEGRAEDTRWHVRKDGPRFRSNDLRGLQQQGLRLFATASRSSTEAQVITAGAQGLVGKNGKSFSDDLPARVALLL